MHTRKADKHIHKGQALVEALIVLVVLIGIFATVMFFGKFGSLTQKGHMGARITTFNTEDKDYAFPYDPSGVSSIEGSLSGSIFDKFGLGPISNILDWLNGTRTGCVESSYSGKVIGTGLGWPTVFTADFRIEYSADQNSWKIDDIAPLTAAYWGLGAIIVFSDHEIDDLAGQGSPVIPEYVQEQWSFK